MPPASPLLYGADPLEGGGYGAEPPDGVYREALPWGGYGATPPGEGYGAVLAGGGYGAISPADDEYGAFPPAIGAVGTGG